MDYKEFKKITQRHFFARFCDNFQEMKPNVCFFDLEVDPDKGRIFDFGAVLMDGSTFHSTNQEAFLKFVKGAEFFCGHNVLSHDISFLQEKGVTLLKPIDTLLLSPLLFPKRPYHHLVKDDKLQTDSFNNPLNDAIQAKNLFQDEVTAFLALDSRFQSILYGL